nr:RNA polymerase II largest subunit [Tanacetum cinerariifolium]
MVTKSVESKNCRLNPETGCLDSSAVHDNQTQCEPEKASQRSARTLITPDPTINIDELGVPWSVALNLTYPETVAPYNKESIQSEVDSITINKCMQIGVFVDEKSG